MSMLKLAASPSLAAIHVLPRVLLDTKPFSMERLPAAEPQAGIATGAATHTDANTPCNACGVCRYRAAILPAPRLPA
jgi:hypothetical protein